MPARSGRSRGRGSRGHCGHASHTDNPGEARNARQSVVARGDPFPTVTLLLRHGLYLPLDRR